MKRAGLVHRVLPPAGASSGSEPGALPTAVLLHGQRGDENSMWVFSRAVPPGWLQVAPRGPVQDPVSGYAWRSREADEWPDWTDFREAVTALRRFIAALPDLYGADLDRLVLVGFSQGAATSVAAVLDDAGIARGLASLVGFVPQGCERAPRGLLAGLPVFYAIGRRDELVPRNVSDRGAATLRRLGADVEAHDYDAGHKLSVQGMKDLAAWLEARDAEFG